VPAAQQPQPTETQAQAYRCHHYGALALSRCYCGELVSRWEYLAAKNERDNIRHAFRSGWRPVRDDAGMVRSMVWSS